MVKSTSSSSSRVLLTCWAKQGERLSLPGEVGLGRGVVSWPAVRMRRPSADGRSLSRKASTSMALQGFTSSTAVSAMRAARRDSCLPMAQWWIALGGSASPSEMFFDYEMSRRLRPSVLPSISLAN